MAYCLFVFLSKFRKKPRGTGIEASVSKSKTLNNAARAAVGKKNNTI